ncbi:serine hydrolase domain-containing protein [soil metagenome]
MIINRGIYFSLHLLFFVFIVFPVKSQKLTVVKPEEAGMSSSRLQRINSLMQKYVDEEKIAGIVTMVSRQGKVVHFEQFGKMDLEGKKPMPKDAIFRITSMTKPILCVAVLLLFEEGHFQLDDPVANFISEFKEIKVWNNGNPIVPKREITIQDLLTHTAGLSHEPPLDSLYRQSNLHDGTLKEMVVKLSKIPLMYHPGEKWQYSYAHDVLGYLIEVVSGMPLDVFMRQRIFQPLNMPDTDFFIPKENINRFPFAYSRGESGKIEVVDPTANEWLTVKPRYFSGGGGLVSTAEDYMKFAIMLINGGEFDGVRLLSPKTVELMTTNHLAPHLLPIMLDPSIPYYTQGYSYGLGVRVLQDVAASGNLGSEGMYGWGGYFSTFYWGDPKEKLVGLLLYQIAAPSTYPINKAFQTYMYQSIIE